MVVEARAVEQSGDHVGAAASTCIFSARRARSFRPRAIELRSTRKTFSVFMTIAGITMATLTARDLVSETVLQHEAQDRGHHRHMQLTDRNERPASVASAYAHAVAHGVAHGEELGDDRRIGEYGDPGITPITRE
jgi:hypothetical protein